MGKLVAKRLNADEPHRALLELDPLFETAPFSPVVRDAIVAAVEKIIAIETDRGEIARAARSALAPAAQPFQDFIDECFFRLAGLTPAEAATIITEHEPEKPSAAVRRTTDSKANSRALSLSLSKTAWADLDVLCQSAMHKDSLRRYRSVEALIRDVDHYLNGEPLEARPDAWRYRIGKFVRRNRRVVAATAMIFAVIYGIAWFNDYPDFYTLMGAAIVIGAGLFMVAMERKYHTTG